MRDERAGDIMAPEGSVPPVQDEIMMDAEIPEELVDEVPPDEILELEEDAA